MDAPGLYRLPPEAFTAARDTEAARRRDDGDRDGARAVKALRRPSVAAWLVNLLAQDSPGLLGELLDLGPALAQAQSGGDAASLRALGAQRRQLVEAVTATAVRAAGRTVTAAVRDEVAATLEAALADPASAQAVRSGRLVRALSYAGFGDVDLSDAVAADAGGHRPAGGSGPAGEGRTSGREAGRRTQTKAQAARAREQERARRTAEAEAAAHDAAGRLDDAVRSCEQAERARAAAQSAADERAEQVDRLVEELDRARADQERAAREADEARLAADGAVAQVRRAQEAAEAAREELDRLRRDQGPPLSAR